MSWMGWGIWDEVERRENMPEEGQAEEGGKERSLSLSAPFKMSLRQRPKPPFLCIVFPHI